MLFLQLRVNGYIICWIMIKTMTKEPTYKSAMTPKGDAFTSVSLGGYRSLDEDTAGIRLHQKVWMSESRTLKCYSGCSIVLFITCLTLLFTMATIGLIMSLDQDRKETAPSTHSLINTTLFSWLWRYHKLLFSNNIQLDLLW